MDGRIVAAEEEERFSRRKHGKRPIPFSAWELPELSARWCLDRAGLTPSDLDAVAYSYHPELARPADQLGLHDPWDHLRQESAAPPSSSPRHCPDSTRTRSASSPTTSRTPPPPDRPHRIPTAPSWCWTAAANAAPTSPAATRTAN
ncbi:hypothetical protein QQY66_06795 [Streptomyces sp. DG2A-72]|nr:hypothetical protein [Streptomyces sp. DG2A-72]MDO0931401.1 hypothetical protein [Streptomyces sp. DG2A-72]